MGPGLPLPPGPKPRGRPAKYDRREIVNALLYIARTGCQWRAMTRDDRWRRPLATASLYLVPRARIAGWSSTYPIG